jgi:tetratricopeptide (TPR) repeat protein
MGQSSVEVRHEAFVVAARATTRGAAPARRVARGGLAVLRLLDARRPTPAELRAARRFVAAVDSAPLRGLLTELVDALGSSVRQMMRLMLAYGHGLADEGYGLLAADVYRTAIGIASSRDDFALVPGAYNQLGDCLRSTGEYEGALAAYRTGRAVAAAIGDVGAGLRFRVAEAKVSRLLGDPQRAESVLTEVIAEAERLGLDSVRTMATHDLGAAHYERGQLDVAAHYFFEAWTHYSDPRHRDRVLGDLARTLADLGMRDAARDALLVISVTAVEVEMRQFALIHLLDLAALDGAASVFDHYRRALGGGRQQLPPRLDVHYAIVVGEGCLRFGRTEQAKAAFLRASRLAAHLQVTDLFRRAEAGLRAIRTGSRLTRATSRHRARSDSDLAPMTSVLKAMRGNAECQNFPISSSISSDSPR